MGKGRWAPAAGLAACLAAAAPARAVEVRVSYDSDGSRAHIQVIQAPEKEPLAALRLRLRLKPGMMGDMIGIIKPMSGPWSQFFPSVASSSSSLRIVAMAPAAGTRPDSGEAVVALIEVSLTGGASPKAAADLIDSALVEEAYAPDGSRLEPSLRLTTGLRPYRREAAAPEFRRRGAAASLVFNLGRGQRVRAWISDMRGRKVADLLDRKLPAGIQEVAWDGKAAGGRAPARGTYLFHLEAGSQFRYDRKLEVAP